MYRDSEKERYAELKPLLFGPEAQAYGIYMGKPRSFCLADGCARENVHNSICERALRYSRERGLLQICRFNAGFIDRPSDPWCCKLLLAKVSKYAGYRPPVWYLFATPVTLVGPRRRVLVRHLEQHRLSPPAVVNDQPRVSSNCPQ